MGTQERVGWCFLGVGEDLPRFDERFLVEPPNCWWHEERPAFSISPEQAARVGSGPGDGSLVWARGN